jgi:hypothetical protein
VGNGMTGQYVVVTSQGTQTVSGVVGDIDIDLSAGDDQVTIDNAYVNGTIDIDAGAGSDKVYLGVTRIVSTRLALVVSLGDNNDVLEGKRLYIGGAQTISGGEGNDQMTLLGSATGAFVLGTSSGGATTITGDAGDDAIHMSYSFIVGAWQSNGGAGSDWITIRTSACNGAVSVIGEAGFDQVIIDTNYFIATLLIDGGAEDDRLGLYNSLGMVAVTMQGAAGADTVLVANLTAKRLTVNTGTEKDGADIRSSLFDEFFANMGDQDDTLQLFGNLVRATASFDGGAGADDAFFNVSNTFRAGFRRVGFER